MPARLVHRFVDDVDARLALGNKGANLVKMVHIGMPVPLGFTLSIDAFREFVRNRCLPVDEIRQSLRIIEQCLKNMPAGPYKADHRLTTPPVKERTMYDIETLIHHFLNVSWGPVIPASECSVAIEATKGINMYYLTSDGGTSSYRTRIRTPSFPHLQQIPLISRGLLIADLIAILASIDFVMADVDR